MSLDVGIGIFTGQVAIDGGGAATSYRAILALAAEAEKVGFDSAWISEHHFAGDSYVPAPLTVLAAVAARTERIRLGTATVLAPFHDPIRLAEEAAVVGSLVIRQATELEGIEYALLTRTFNEFASGDEKQRLIDCLYALATADDEISLAEDEEIRAVARALLLSHDQFIRIRLQYKDKLEVIRSVRKLERGS